MLEKIAAMLEEQLGTVDAGDITEETSFKDDLGADSLDLFELVMQCAISVCLVSLLVPKICTLMPLKKAIGDIPVLWTI